MKSMELFLNTIRSMYHLEDRPAGEEWTVEESYTFCRNLTYSHYENFPVGSLLIPKHLRKHVHAIYAFARVADDFADEEEYKGTRLERLSEWGELLKECYHGQAKHPIFIALGETVKEIELPIELFEGLLNAFKMDVTVTRYEDFGQVMGYCRYSADPVGRLILHLFDYRDEELFRMSDNICSALQLANHWQDVTIDLKKDRIYIPREEMKREGYTENELFSHVYDERFYRLMDSLVQRTWDLFDRGYPLLERVRWPLNAELRFTWMGGVTILSRIFENRCDVFSSRPTLSKWDYAHWGVRSLLGIGRIRERLRQKFQAKQ